MGFGASPKDQDNIPLSAGWSEANNSILPIRGRYSQTDTNGNTTIVIEVAPLESVATSVTSVSASASAVTILAASSSTKGIAVYNDSTVNMYLKMGASASTTSFTVKIPAGGYYESPAAPIYTGIYTALWDSATGAARVTQLT
jgi:hypothetical protein